MRHQLSIRVIALSLSMYAEPYFCQHVQIVTTSVPIYCTVKCFWSEAKSSNLNVYGSVAYYFKLFFWNPVTSAHDCP